MQIDRTYDHAENVGGDQSQLLSAKTNDADNDAVNRAQQPAFPVTPPD